MFCQNGSATNLLSAGDGGAGERRRSTSVVGVFQPTCFPQQQQPYKKSSTTTTTNRTLSPLPPLSPLQKQRSTGSIIGVACNGDVQQQQQHNNGCCNNNGRNLFSHIPLNSALLEHMNRALFQEIKNRQADFMRAFNGGDARGAAEIYDPDGYFMPNGRTPVKGRDGIERFFEQDIADGVNSAQIITEEVNGSGDWAFERGSYHLETSRGTECGAYLQVWKRINGMWLIHNDCFNVVQARNKA